MSEQKSFWSLYIPRPFQGTLKSGPKIANHTVEFNTDSLSVYKDRTEGEEAWGVDIHAGRLQTLSVLNSCLPGHSDLSMLSFFWTDFLYPTLFQSSDLV